jgi:PleD family two-component response regulator
MKKNLVFILDRDPVQGNYLKYSLSSSGIKDVIIFLRPEECLKNIRETRKPEFIIADDAPKNMTGMEFLKLIREIDASIKVIFHSENEDLSRISSLLEMGATDYVVRVVGNKNWIRELTSNLQYLIKEELLLG